MSIEGMYQEVILDHHRHPIGRGLREPFGGQAHHINTSCGDELTVRVALSADGTRVEDVSWEGDGCAISVASMSVLCDNLTGATVEQSLQSHGAFLELMHSKGQGTADPDLLADAVAFTGVAQFPARVKCALLGWMAFEDALSHARDVTQTSSRAQGGTHD